MATETNFSQRVAAAGTLIFAALSVPVVAALLAGPVADSATGGCLAWFGNKDDGICMGYSNGNGTTIGTPQIGVFGPDYGNGLGITSGPLLPGQTITQGLNP